MKKSVEIETHPNPEFCRLIGYAKVDADIDRGLSSGDLQKVLQIWLRKEYPNRNPISCAKLILELRPPKYTWDDSEEILTVLKNAKQ
jgi:hypothetical protein